MRIDAERVGELQPFGEGRVANLPEFDLADEGLVEAGQSPEFDLGEPALEAECPDRVACGSFGHA